MRGNSAFIGGLLRVSNLRPNVQLFFAVKHPGFFGQVAASKPFCFRGSSLLAHAKILSETSQPIKPSGKRWSQIATS